MAGIFNHAAVYEMPHMVPAAYMVACFLVAGVYAADILRGRREASVYWAGLLRGPRDRYNYTGFALGFVPAAMLTPVQINAGAPDATLVALVVLFIAVAAIIGPAFALLFTLQGRRMLDPAEAPPSSSTSAGKSNDG
jgi:hypothetical protein